MNPDEGIIEPILYFYGFLLNLPVRYIFSCHLLIFVALGTHMNSDNNLYENTRAVMVGPDNRYLFLLFCT